nr:YchJ family metal-binding protein [uncultured Desulfobulbus sp.]
MSRQSLCPCESGLDYDSCCGPLLAGERTAPTAEALMRSRYTAYTRVALDYLLKSWHPSTRPASIEVESIPHWCGLEILDTHGGQVGDLAGVVEFRATALGSERLIVLRERSQFIFEEGAWLYVDGEFIQEEEPPSSPEPSSVSKAGAKAKKKIGRNDPCPCGSGRKYKKCCGL